MKLQHLSTTRNADGMYEVDVSIGGKKYTYNITSEYAINLFMAHYKDIKRHGHAIATLNRYMYRGEGI